MATATVGLAQKKIIVALDITFEQGFAQMFCLAVFSDYPCFGSVLHQTRYCSKKN